MQDDQDEPVVIDLSSMIDCVFILLIFFIVSTVFVEETGVTVNKPDVGAAAASLEKNSILIAVTADNKIFYGGESIGIQGIIGKIKPLLTENPDMPVIIQANTPPARPATTTVRMKVPTVIVSPASTRRRSTGPATSSRRRRIRSRSGM